MSWLKFSVVLSTGVLLVGLSAKVAMSQDAAPPRDRGDVWDGGPAPGGADGVRRPRPLRGDEAGTPGPREVRGDGDQPPPGNDPRRPPRSRSQDGDRGRPPEGPGGRDENGPPRRGGPDGDRQPPGPPPGYAPRGREDFESLKTRDPELYKAIQEDRDLERQTRDQAEQYRRASKDEQAKVKEKLIEIVNKHFAVRQQLRNLEVKQLEQQLKQLRDKIDQREKKRKEIIEKRIIELTGADEGEHF